MDAIRKIGLITFAVLLGLLISFPLCVAQIYKMVDDKGHIYFTDDPGKLSDKYKNEIRTNKDERPDGKLEKQSPRKRQDLAAEKKPMIPPEKEGVEQKVETETTRPLLEEKRPVQEEKGPDQEVKVNPPERVEQDKMRKVEEIRDRLSKMEQFPLKTASVFGTLLGLVGLVIMMGGGIWFIVLTFRTSVGWGFACLFVPFAFFVFLAKYWKAAWRPVGVNILGAVLLCGAIFHIF